MKRRNGWIFLGIVFVIVCCAMGEFFLRMPVHEKKRCIEVVQGREHFPNGELLFRKQDKKSGAVLSVYETQMAVLEVIAQVRMSMEKDRWNVVFETASMVIFENKRGYCAAINAYEAESGKTRVSILVQR